MSRSVISVGSLSLLFLLVGLVVYACRLPVAAWVVLASAAVLLILFLLAQRSVRSTTTKA